MRFEIFCGKSYRTAIAIARFGTTEILEARWEDSNKKLTEEELDLLNEQYQKRLVSHLDELIKTLGV